VRFNALRFLGWGEVCSDHLDVMVTGRETAEYTKRIWDGLFGALRGEWDVFEYYDAPVDSPVLGSFLALAREDKRCLNTEHTKETVCPYLVLPGSWDEFLDGCSGSRRYTITYSMKKLAEQGTLERRLCERLEDLTPFMDAFVSLHQKSWTARGKPGAFSSARFEAFHRRVAKDFFDKGVLFLCSFHLDGRHIGSFYGFQYDGTLSYYLLGVETNPVKKVKTGTAVIGQCIEQAIRRGCREFDFLRGAEEYKYRWTSTDRRNANVRFYNRTGPALALLAGRSSYRAARRVLKPLLGKRGVRLKRLLGW
jgi:CelD/BcsL family acetyltransferase involved in cellulose biosynthesis